jgi:hypothetical protein
MGGKSNLDHFPQGGNRTKAAASGMAMGTGEGNPLTVELAGHGYGDSIEVGNIDFRRE